MSFYTAFLTRAMQFYFPDLVVGKTSHENPNIFMVVPSKHAVLSYHGLWITNGFDRPNLFEGKQGNCPTEYRQIRIEEWHSLPSGQEITEDGGVIRIRRFQTRSLQAGIRRSIQLSETLLSELLQENISLTPEQQKDCIEFAQSKSRSLKKKKQEPER